MEGGASDQNTTSTSVEGCNFTF